MRSVIGIQMVFHRRCGKSRVDMQRERIVKNKLSKESVERMQIGGCAVWSRAVDTKRANIHASSSLGLQYLSRYCLSRV